MANRFALNPSTCARFRSLRLSPAESPAFAVGTRTLCGPADVVVLADSEDFVVDVGELGCGGAAVSSGGFDFGLADLLCLSLLASGPISCSGSLFAAFVPYSGRSVAKERVDDSVRSSSGGDIVLRASACRAVARATA